MSGTQEEFEKSRSLIFKPFLKWSCWALAGGEGNNSSFSIKTANEQIQPGLTTDEPCLTHLSLSHLGLT